MTGQNPYVGRMFIEIRPDVVLRYPKVRLSLVDRLLGFVVNRYWGKAVVDVI
jgi:hypothetical protein